MKKVFVISGVVLCMVVVASQYVQSNEKSQAVDPVKVAGSSVQVATSAQEYSSVTSPQVTRSWLEGSQSQALVSELEQNTPTELTKVRSSLPRGFAYTASSSQNAPPELRDYGVQFFALTSEYVVVADEERAFMAFKDSNLIEAAKFFSLAGTRYEALALKLDSVKPPQTLESTQKKLVSIYRILSQAYHTLSKEAQDKKISNEALTAQAYAVTSTAAPLSSILTFLYSYGITQP